MSPESIFEFRAPSPPGVGAAHTTSRSAQKWQCFLQPTSLEMRCTVPVPIPSDLATFKMPTPFASCFRTFRSVALSIFGRPSFTPWARARLGLARFAERDLWNIDSGSASLRLDVEGPDDVAPLLRFVGDELAEVGGRTNERCATQIGKLRLDFRVGERGIDLPVELVDDFGRRAFG